MNTSSVLTGSDVVVTGFNPAQLGMEFATVPAGAYPIGEEGSCFLPPEQVNLEAPFQVATTPVTNDQFAKGLAALEGRDTGLMALLPNGSMKLFARGTRKAVESFTLGDMERALKDSVTLAEMRVVQGGFEAFHMEKILADVVQRGPVTLVHRLSEMGEEFRGPKKPVVEVFGNEADMWAQALDLRLLTEKEREIAARGPKGLPYGTSTGELYDAAGKKLAHFDEKGTADVGSYPANWIGAFDMTGNVWEYTSSHILEAGVLYRIRRGGSWANNDGRYLRAAYRGLNHPDYRCDSIGFRVGRQDSNG